jgi:N-acetyl-gamma-glutamyl-phosphate reductase
MTKAGIAGFDAQRDSRLAVMLGRHPNVTLSCINSTLHAGQRLADLCPALEGQPAGDLICTRKSAIDLAMESDVLLLLLERGAAMQIAGQILDLDCRVIDLSSDFRLRDVETYEKWTGTEHVAANLIHDGTVVYGLAELNADLVRGAKFVANPGVLATAVALSVAPLLLSGMVTGDGIVVDAWLPHSNEAGQAVVMVLAAAEIEQELSACRPGLEKPVRVTIAVHETAGGGAAFVTTFAPLSEVPSNQARAARALREAYREASFIAVQDGDLTPNFAGEAGSNRCRIGVRIDPGTRCAVVTAAFDAHLKGSAGQAVQNLNLMFGLPEESGLSGES